MRSRARATAQPSYLEDEVLPSLAALRADGFTPESVAYPYGSHTPETDALIAPHVRYLRNHAGCARASGRTARAACRRGRR